MNAEMLYFYVIILCRYITELITIMPPITNKNEGTSPNIRKLSKIPKIGNKE